MVSRKSRNYRREWFESLDFLHILCSDPDVKAKFVLTQKVRENVDNQRKSKSQIKMVIAAMIMSGMQLHATERY